MSKATRGVQRSIVGVVVLACLLGVPAMSYGGVKTWTGVLSDWWNDAGRELGPHRDARGWR